jgi:hypothetical protein
VARQFLGRRDGIGRFRRFGWFLLGLVPRPNWIGEKEEGSEEHRKA